MTQCAERRREGVRDKLRTCGKENKGPSRNSQRPWMGLTVAKYRELGIGRENGMRLHMTVANTFRKATRDD